MQVSNHLKSQTGMRKLLDTCFEVNDCSSTWKKDTYRSGLCRERNIWSSVVVLFVVYSARMMLVKEHCVHVTVKLDWMTSSGCSK